MGIRRALCDLANLAAFVVETADSNRRLEIPNIGGLIKFKVVQGSLTIFSELERGAIGEADLHETAITGQQDITAINRIPSTQYFSGSIHSSHSCSTRQQTDRTNRLS